MAAALEETLAPFQVELLELAFSTASRIPVQPHVKTRGNAQERVVAACLELEQPERAEEYLRKIGNWRQGAAWADLAYYLALHGGEQARIQACLEAAEKIARAEASSPEMQQWRPDRIRAKIARTHLLLGQEALAAEFQKGMADSEVGLVDAERARRLEREDVPSELEDLAAIAATGNVDLLKGRLEAGAELFDRFYEDGEVRRKVEDAMRAAWERIPLMMRIDALASLVDAAVAHGDPEKALSLVDEAKSVAESVKWTAEYEVPLRARLAALRHGAGDEKAGRDEAHAATALFDAEVASIVDIFRTEALLPLAEAYRDMGDPRAALAVYRRAVEESVHNVNSVPRAEDLVDICLSMAREEVEPDPRLRARLLEVTESLSDPW